MCPEPSTPRGATAAENSEAELEALVFEALEVFDHEGPEGVDRLLARRPAHSARLRERLEALRAAGLLDPSQRNQDFPEQLGDFDLLERLGAGGMGVVYRARQRSLDREVALKLVRPDQLFFPGTRERFQREVLLAAKLKHPGIVPVYSVGEERGLPYFAMELIHGASLAEVIARLRGEKVQRLRGFELLRALGPIEHPLTPDGERLCDASWTRAVLFVVHRVAEALAYAHAAGVLHRDVKPANLMLVRDGRVLLGDFGLASSPSAARVTRTGSALGSLPYMAPELLRSEEFDARADVYALGVTLYELLALRAPYWDNDSEALRRQILEGRPLPLRRLVPEVDAELETVCMTAMAPERSRRYASAADFAAELARLIEHRPIVARRAGALLVARRWAERHPAQSVALASSVLLLGVGPLLFAWQQARARERLDQANVQLASALEGERHAREQAEANLKRARSAVDTLLTELGSDEFLGLPGVEELRRRLLESALSYYEEFLTQTPDSPELLVGCLEAVAQAGYLQQQLGRSEQALASYRQSAAWVEALAAQGGAAEVVDRWRASSAMGQGAALQSLGRLEEADQRLEEALALREQCFARQAGDYRALMDLKESLGWAAARERLRGDLESALALQQRSFELNAQAVLLAETEEQRVWALLEWFVGANAVGSTLRQMGDPAGARAVLARAFEATRDFRPESDQEGYGNAAYAACLLLRAALDKDQGQLESAEQGLRQGLQVLEELCARRPQLVEAGRSLAAAWNQLASLIDVPARSQEAEEAYLASLEVLRKIHERHPELVDLGARMGMTLNNLGGQYFEQGRVEESRAALTESEQLLADALELVPDAQDWRMARRNCLWFHTLLELSASDPVQAGSLALALGESVPGHAQTLRLAAELSARCVPLAAGDAERASRWTGQGLELLALAVQAGCTDAEWVASSEGFAPLRTAGEFPQLLQGLRDNLEAAQAEQAAEAAAAAAATHTAEADAAGAR